MFSLTYWTHMYSVRVKLTLESSLCTTPISQIINLGLKISKIINTCQNLSLNP
uniref:Uncharacterized protein n=1 Tax=Anguilla anguilla TaxID=7936 RepID=A0A0E9S580_ANGAN